MRQKENARITFDNIRCVAKNFMFFPVIKHNRTLMASISVHKSHGNKLPIEENLTVLFEASL